MTAAHLLKHLFDWKRQCRTVRLCCKYVVGSCGFLAGSLWSRGVPCGPEQMAHEELEGMDVLLPEQQILVLQMFLACKEQKFRKEY